MQSTKDEIKEIVFSTIQTFLKTPPVIIWGSGATIPFGLPSMTELNRCISEQISSFDGKSNNLEDELGKDKYLSILPDIRKIIWKTVKEADEKNITQILQDSSKYDGIYKLICKCIGTAPKVANIITTNYDRILEYVMSYYGIPFTDGFNGRLLSAFDKNLFLKKEIVNLVKVHGSINWGEYDGVIRYMDNNSDFTPVIIPPGKNKYREAYHEPYRDLISFADQLITNANSLFIVGFGFNDEHLTPKVKAKANNGTPIVLITLKITDTTHTELQKAKEYVLLECAEPNKSKVYIKKNGKENVYTIDGNYWQLNNFMEEIL